MTPLTPEQVAALNPGIRSTVLKLREWGFETIDSGDGVTRDFACDMGVPYVHVRVHPTEMAWMANCLMGKLQSECGIDFSNAPNPQVDPDGWAKHPTIEASYSPVDGHAFITITNVILP